MTARERGAFVRVAEILVAPVPPLPAVRDTDAVAALEHSLAAGPRLNELALRAGLLFVDRRLRRVPPAALERGAFKPLMKVMASLAHLHYYGDDRVMRLLGYDPDAVLARAAQVRP
jgi:hypothetical protein